MNKDIPTNMTKFKIHMVKDAKELQLPDGTTKKFDKEEKDIEITAEYAAEAYVKSKNSDGWYPVSYEIIGKNNQHITKIDGETKKMLEKIKAKKEAERS